MTVEIRPGVPASIALTALGGRELDGTVTWVGGEIIEVELSGEPAGPGEQPAFLVVGAPGSQQAAAALWEGEEQGVARLRLTGPWRPVEERRSKRAPAGARMTIDAGEKEVVATVLNVSRDGLGARTDRALPAGRVLATVEADGVPVTFPCEIVRSARRDGAWEHGLRFEALSPAQIAAVEALIAEAAEAA